MIRGKDGYDSLGVLPRNEGRGKREGGEGIAALRLAYVAIEAGCGRESEAWDGSEGSVMMPRGAADETTSLGHQALEPEVGLREEAAAARYRRELLRQRRAR
jgi:hypothetical protein